MRTTIYRSALIVAMICATVLATLLIIPAGRSDPIRPVVSDAALVTRVQALQAEALDATKKRLSNARAGVQSRDRIIKAQRRQIEKLKDQLAARSSFQ